MVVVLAGAVRGLISEGKRIADLFENNPHEVLALSISKESLSAMATFIKAGKERAKPDNFEEVIYAKHLSKFGDVRKPPPCFVEPWKIAIRKKIQIEPLDMNDDQYTNAYCRNVGTLELLGLGKRDRRLKKYNFKSDTPEKFVLEWDKIVTSTKGFRKLEKEREAFMAKQIKRLANNHNNIFVVAELERLAGIERRLKKAQIETIIPK